MKKRPIIFSGPMVRALLNGTKTQTRRVVKPQPTECGLEWATACGGDFAAWHDPGLMLDEHSEDGGPCQRVCPYGQPGDRLWVRETWQMAGGNTGYWYAATDSQADDGGPPVSRWAPSIYMPRAASRITLEVTGVRVERLQHISEADALSEGIERLTYGGLATYRNYSITDDLAEVSPMLESQIDSYRTLWESINGPESWTKNPWVWVVEFKQVEN